MKAVTAPASPPTATNGTLVRMKLLCREGSSLRHVLCEASLQSLEVGRLEL
jgi:hypothetical protein